MTAILCEFDGALFRPVSDYHLKRAAKHYEAGERYLMREAEDRSLASHNHYFASLNDAWKNLPEGMEADFPTVEHLRKFALIQTGYHTQQTYACGSPEEAVRLAAALRSVDEFSVVVIRGATVTRMTAQSQSIANMGRRTFQKSKDAVLDYVSNLIGVRRDDLERNARTAA